MPKQNPYRTQGPDTKRDLWWAAGVFEAAGRIQVQRNPDGKITGTRIYAFLEADTAQELCALVGGVWTGQRWVVRPEDQRAVALTLIKHVASESVAARLHAVLAFRRTLGKRGVTLDPEIHRYRDRLARRIEAHKPRIPKEAGPLAEEEEG